MAIFNFPLFLVGVGDYENARDFGAFVPTFPIVERWDGFIDSADTTLSVGDKVDTGADGPIIDKTITAIEFRTLEIGGASVDVAVLFPQDEAFVVIVPLSLADGALSGGELALGDYGVGVTFANTGFSLVPPAGGSAPTGVPDSYDTAFETPLVVPVGNGVLANDIEPDGDTVTATLDTVPSNGAVSLDASGAFTYTPNDDFSGDDSFTYIASDSDGPSGSTTVTVTVGVPTPPTVARLVAYSVTDGALSSAISPLASNTLVLGAPIVAEVDSADAILSVGDLVSNEGFGTLFDDPISEVLYRTLSLGGVDYAVAILRFDSSVENLVIPLNLVTGETAPGPLPAGTYAFGPAFASSGVTIIDTVNGAPTAVGDAYSVSAGGTLTIAADGVLGNDTDPDDDALSASLVTGPSDGMLTLVGDGGFTYTPNPGFTGTDSFTYRASDGALDSAPATVEITVTAAPTPTSVLLVAYSVTDGALSSAISPLAPNTLVLGAPIVAEVDSADAILSVGDLVSNEGFGTLFDDPISEVLYRTLSLGGVDYAVAILRFDSSVENLVIPLNLVTGETAPGPLPAGTYDFGPALMPPPPLLVTTVNTPPVITSPPSFALDENTTAVGTVTSTDADAVATASYSISGGADAALFAIDAGTGALSFLAAPDFEAPGDADGDNVYDIEVTVTDDQMATAVQAVAITVEDANDAPVQFAPPMATFGEDDADQTIQLLTGSFDPDVGDVVTVKPGTLVLLASDLRAVGFDLQANGALTLTPGQFDDLADGDILTIDASYFITDGVEDVAASAQITITGVDETVLAGDDSASVTDGATVTIDVLANDSTSGAASLTITEVAGTAIAPGGSVALASGAIVSLDASGELVYDPNDVFDLSVIGARVADDFLYTVSDGVSEATASVSIQVDADQDTDGVADRFDNAIFVFNPDQRDSNGDGYGNVIDPDLDNDGFVGAADLGLFRLAFGQFQAVTPTDAGLDADFDGDGLVGSADLGILRSFFGGSPGASFVDFTFV